MYILILPAFGIVSEIIPVFSRKPIFGYPFMVFSGIAIGFMGWGVWAHHMFASGIGPISVAAFSLSTMFIAVPTGVKILNWLATMWGGKLQFTTPMLFAVGLVRDVHHRWPVGRDPRGRARPTPSRPTPTTSSPTSTTCSSVARCFGFFGGFYFWWPKVFGYFLDEKLGQGGTSGSSLVGFNLTFGPMHILGLQGMRRRIYTYRDGYGFDFWNLVATIGAFIIAVGMLVFFVNIVQARSAAAPASRPRAPIRGTPAASSG